MSEREIERQQCLDNRGSINFALLEVWLLLDCLSTVLVLLLNGAEIVAQCLVRIGCPSSRLAASLAAADFLVGVTAVCGIIVAYSCAAAEAWGDTLLVCYGRYFLFLTAHSASWYGVAALGLDRYIAIMRALQYQHIMNKRNTNILIGLVWGLAVTNAGLYMVNNGWTVGKPCVDENFFMRSVFIAVVIANTIVVLALCAWVHFSVHRAAVASETAHQKMGRGVGRRSRVFIIVASSIFILSYIPLVTFGVLRLWKYETTPDLSLLYAVALTFSRVNAIANPILYAWRNTAVRTAILNRLKNKFPWMKISNFPSEENREDTSRGAVQTRDVGL